MPHDICLSANASRHKPALPAVAPIAAIVFAAIAMALALPAPSPDLADQAHITQDWHGNVMRSHWTATPSAR